MVLASLLTAAALIVLTGYQVTGRTAGVRLLSRLSETLVELDRWLPAHEDDLKAQAQERPAGIVIIDTLPVQVRLAATRVASSSSAMLADSIGRGMGESLYERGTSAFVRAGGDAGLSATEPVRWAVSLLDRSSHARWRAALLIVGLFFAGSMAGVLMTGSSALQPLLIGASVAAVVSLAVWLLAKLGASVTAGPVDEEIMLMLRDGAWIGVRNSLAVIGASSALLLVLALVNRQRAREYGTSVQSRNFPPA
jgi:hypothetical protein